MKKNIKVVIAFILGGIVFGGVGIGIYASTVSSSVVTYTKSDNTNTTVEGALNELYDKSDNLMPETLEYYARFGNWINGPQTNGQMTIFFQKYIDLGYRYVKYTSNGSTYNHNIRNNGSSENMVANQKYDMTLYTHVEIGGYTSNGVYDYTFVFSKE